MPCKVSEDMFLSTWPTTRVRSISELLSSVKRPLLQSTDSKLPFKMHISKSTHFTALRASSPHVCYLRQKVCKTVCTFLASQNQTSIYVFSNMASRKSWKHVLRKKNYSASIFLNIWDAHKVRIHDIRRGRGTCFVYPLRMGKDEEIAYVHKLQL